MSVVQNLPPAQILQIETNKKVVANDFFFLAPQGPFAPFLTLTFSSSKYKKVSPWILSLFLLQNTLQLLFPLLMQHSNGQTPTNNNIEMSQEDVLKGLAQSIDQSRKACGIPGMAVAILFKGELIFAEGFGIRNEQQEPFTPEVSSRRVTVFLEF